MKQILYFAFILTLICSVASASLSWVYNKTKPKIEENKVKQLELAKKEVLSVAQKFEDSEKCFIGKDETGKIVGKVIKGQNRGYAGPIIFLVGVNNENKIVNLKILEQTETPGLGSGITSEKFWKQFIGKSGGQLQLKKDGGEINGITGATISSHALIDGVRESLSQVE